MDNAINSDVIDVEVTTPSVPAPNQESVKSYPGISFMGLRFTYISTDHPSGWCHHEGDVIARSLFSVSTLHDPIPGKNGGLVKTGGIRIVIGRHSLWILS